MPANKLNRNEPFGQIYGDADGRHFEQDGAFYTQDGKLWRDPKAKESAADRAAREKAEAEEAQRLADEEAARKAAAGGDDQLNAQLGQ